MGDVTTGDGYAVGSIDAMGEGYGFRKVRRELGVESMGINGLVFPPGYAGARHYHDEQEEIYFVHSGRFSIEFGDGTSHVLEPGGVARVDAHTVRRIRNVGEEDGVILVMGAKGGYVGRDGQLAEGESGRVSPPNG